MESRHRQRHGPRPPLDQTTGRICKQSGISLIKDRLITLQDLARGLKTSIREAEAAEASGRFWEKAVVAARFTSATCNVLIDVMAEWIPNQKAAKLVKKVYDHKDILADASVGKVDVYKIGKTAVADMTRIAATRGTISKEAETATKEIGKRADLVHDGLTGKLDAKKAVKYVIDGHFDIAKTVMEEIKGEVGGKFVSTAKSIYTFSMEISEIVEDSKKSRSDLDGLGSSKKTLQAMLRKIEHKIHELEAQIKACDMPELEMKLSGRPTDTPRA